MLRNGQRKKLSRAANDVNRECGTKGAISVGSGELSGSTDALILQAFHKLLPLGQL